MTSHNEELAIASAVLAADFILKFNFQNFKYCYQMHSFILNTPKHTIIVDEA